MLSPDLLAIMISQDSSKSSPHVIAVVKIEKKHKIVKICIVFMTLCFGCYSIMKSQNEILGSDIGYFLSCPLYPDSG